MLRQPIRNDFKNAAQWEGYDVMNVGQHLPMFNSGAFDGRYVSSETLLALAEKAPEGVDEVDAVRAARDGMHVRT